MPGLLRAELQWPGCPSAWACVLGLSAPRSIATCVTGHRRPDRTDSPDRRAGSLRRLPAALSPTCSRRQRRRQRSAPCRASPYSGQTIDVQVEQGHGQEGRQAQAEEWPADFDEFIEEDEAEQDPAYEEEEEEEEVVVDAEAEAGKCTRCLAALAGV